VRDVVLARERGYHDQGERGSPCSRSHRSERLCCRNRNPEASGPRAGYCPAPRVDKVEHGHRTRRLRPRSG
jgi:hypothetical protein